MLIGYSTILARSNLIHMCIRSDGKRICRKGDLLHRTVAADQQIALEPDTLSHLPSRGAACMYCIRSLTSYVISLAPSTADIIGPKLIRDDTTPSSIGTSLPILDERSSRKG